MREGIANDASSERNGGKTAFANAAAVSRSTFFHFVICCLLVVDSQKDADSAVQPYCKLLRLREEKKWKFVIGLPNILYIVRRTPQTRFIFVSWRMIQFSLMPRNSHWAFKMHAHHRAHPKKRTTTAAHKRIILIFWPWTRSRRIGTILCCTFLFPSHRFSTFAWHANSSSVILFDIWSIKYH